MKIFLDMDGVISDFVGACENLFHRKLYAKMKKYNDVPKLLGITHEEFWQRVANFSGDFWYGMEPYPWAKILIKECQKLTKDIFIATSPAEDPSCARYKMAWLQKHTDLTTKEIFITGSKHLLAAPGRVLIDDYESNIKKWEEGGGIGILFPRPWNKHRAVSDQCLRYTLNKLTTIFDLNKK